MLIVHTLWNQLLLELLLDLLNTLQICYRHMEEVHEEVLCWKNTFLTNLQGFSDLAPSKWCLIVYTLWNQLLLELSLDLFNTLQVCYRHIEDVHEEVWCWKNIFWQTYGVFNFAIFIRLHLVNYCWSIDSAQVVKSTPLRAFTESFQHFADMLQTYVSL